MGSFVSREVQIASHGIAKFQSVLTIRSFVHELWRDLLTLLAIWSSLKSILPAVVCLASCRIGLYHKIAPEAGPGIARVSYGKDYSYSYLTRETLQTRPAELIISCGQHFLASNCNTCICCCANCYSYTAVQLLYILMYAQSSSIATASSLWCELSDQVQCV